MSVSVQTSVRTDSTLEIVRLSGYPVYIHHRVVVVYFMLCNYSGKLDVCE